MLFIQLDLIGLGLALAEAILFAICGAALLRDIIIWGAAASVCLSLLELDPVTAVCAGRANDRLTCCG
jgi:hypothetical protein